MAKRKGLLEETGLGVDRKSRYPKNNKQNVKQPEMALTAGAVY